MLNNPVYVGVAMHKGVSYPGEHIGIIDRKTWDKVQAKFQESPRKRAAATRAQTPALLKGIIFGPAGTAMSPTHTRKNGRLYRYYLSQTVLKQGAGDCPVARVPAAEIEKIVDRSGPTSTSVPRNHRPDLAQRPQIHQGLDRV